MLELKYSLVTNITLIFSILCSYKWMSEKQFLLYALRHIPAYSESKRLFLTLCQNR